MSETGFLYVLANSAMPGLVKVGKTTRTASERAGELSGVTGLPTPFIVVYEQFFEDCGRAEVFVHTLLAEKGFRVSDNREFFSAPANEVVKAIVLAPGAIDIDSVRHEQSDEEGVLPSRSETDELDEMGPPSVDVRNPWDTVLAEADGHYHGLGNYIQDYAEALQAFKRAAQLGSLSAYARLGQMYEIGQGVAADPGRGFEYYKEGARRGSPFCYWLMSESYVRSGAIENARKCFARFTQCLPAGGPDGKVLTDDDWQSILRSCVHSLVERRDDSEPLPIIHSFVVQHSKAIAAAARETLAYFMDHNQGVGGTGFRSVISYLETL